MRLHICRVTLEPSSVYKNHKIYAYWLYDFFISLHLFYFWWPNAHKPSETLQFMALPCNWRLIHGLTDKSDTVVEFDSDRCFFLLWLPNFRKFCMSKQSCSYVIIVPWNNIQKRLLLSIFSMQRRLWRVCTFAQAHLSLRPGTEISCAGPNNDLCTVYKNSECCGEAAPATTGILCNHQCVVSMRQKMLPVRCNKKFSIKHLLVTKKKNPKQ